MASGAERDKEHSLPIFPGGRDGGEPSSLRFCFNTFEVSTLAECTLGIEAYDLLAASLYLIVARFFFCNSHPTNGLCRLVSQKGVFNMYLNDPEV